MSEEVGGSSRKSLNNILQATPGIVRSGTQAVGLFAAGFLEFIEAALPNTDDFQKSDLAKDHGPAAADAIDVLTTLLLRQSYLLRADSRRT